MQISPCVLQAAPAEWVQPQHLPQLPTWWPPPPVPTDEDPHPAPLSAVAREAARQVRAVQEARRGPHDGTRGDVVLLATGPPQLLHVTDGGGFAYRLVEAESQPGWCVYRYSPADSPLHAESMRAVEQAFAEATPDYGQLARTDEAEHFGITAERIA